MTRTAEIVANERWQELLSQAEDSGITREDILDMLGPDMLPAMVVTGREAKDVLDLLRLGVYLGKVSALPEGMAWVWEGIKEMGIQTKGEGNES